MSMCGVPQPPFRRREAGLAVLTRFTGEPRRPQPPVDAETAYSRRRCIGVLQPAASSGRNYTASAPRCGQPCHRSTHAKRQSRDRRNPLESKNRGALPLSPVNRERTRSETRRKGSNHELTQPALHSAFTPLRGRITGRIVVRAAILHLVGLEIRSVRGGRGVLAAETAGATARATETAEAAAHRAVLLEPLGAAQPRLTIVLELAEALGA